MARLVFELTAYYHCQQTVSQTNQTTCRLRIERVELKKTKTGKTGLKHTTIAACHEQQKITESPNAARGDKLSEDHR